ncbi:Uncharacterised protein [Mycobacteroides abscessus subsp. abscessus]|nr:Uncharacterised protein [Mycobacteroides abscessus subsp. abscessus]
MYPALIMRFGGALTSVVPNVCLMKAVPSRSEVGADS